MGIEPTYSGSAGRRLNRSATPALDHKNFLSQDCNKGLSAYPKLLNNFSIDL